MRTVSRDSSPGRAGAPTAACSPDVHAAGYGAGQHIASGCGIRWPGHTARRGAGAERRDIVPIAGDSRRQRYRSAVWTAPPVLLARRGELRQLPDAGPLVQPQPVEQQAAKHVPRLLTAPGVQGVGCSRPSPARRRSAWSAARCPRLRSACSISYWQLMRRYARHARERRCPAGTARRAIVIRGASASGGAADATGVPPPCCW